MSEKKRLKQLVTKRQLDEVFNALEGAFSAFPTETNELITLKVKNENAESSYKVGAMTDAAYNVEIAQVTRGVLILIDALPDEAEMPSEGKPLQDYHRFTCDRVEQSDRFYAAFESQTAQKLQYYYIDGMEKHAHEGLFQRFAFDLEGKLQDYLTTAAIQSACQSLKLIIPYADSGSIDGYKRNVLKSLFVGMGVKVDEQAPILEKTLADLLALSPRLKDLGEEDYVCIFLSVSEWEWDIDITPAVVSWFISTFCGVELAESSPTFLFFFGLIYEEEDPEIEEEVQAAIEAGGNIQILPELTKVSQRDIKKWLHKYKNNLDLSTEERKSIMSEFFKSEDGFYMESVEDKLAQIIIKHNKKFYS